MMYNCHSVNFMYCYCFKLVLSPYFFYTAACSLQYDLMLLIWLEINWCWLFLIILTLHVPALNSGPELILPQATLVTILQNACTTLVD